MRTIKKILYIQLMAMLMIACNNATADEETGYGQVSLAVSTSADLSVTTRAATDAELADYNIAVYQNGKEVMAPVKYSILTNGTFTMKAGTGYTVTDESCTPAVSGALNDYWGQFRIAGESNPFTVVEGEVVPVAFTCTIQNARVNFAYDQSFTNLFTDFSVTVNKPSNLDRSLVFDSESTFNSKSAFFNLDSGSKMNFTINAKYNGKDRVVTGSVDMSPATWYRITVSSSGEGQISFSVNIDDSIGDSNHDVSINPYG